MHASWLNRGDPTFSIRSKMGKDAEAGYSARTRGDSERNSSWNVGIFHFVENHPKNPLTHATLRSILQLWKKKFRR